MIRKNSLCFIDDDVAELERIRKALGDYFVLGAGTSVKAALDDLEKVQGSRRVDLYVLDMYFPRQGPNSPEELSRLGEAWDDFRKAEADLKVVLHQLGQDFDGGRKLAEQVSPGGSFTRKPFVFFTRKGNLIDAITAYEHTRALSVIKKPDPREQFDEANRQ
jgi:CheY-like chemotaxis protein